MVYSISRLQSGFWKVLCQVFQSNWMNWRISMDLPFRGFCKDIMYSWVEMLLSKTLTSVAAKSIAATMTSTASTAGYELGLLAAAGP